MRMMFIPLLLLIVFCAACPGSTALAGEKESHGVALRPTVYWMSQSGLNEAGVHRQFKLHRGLVYQLERKERDCGNKTETLWNI
jgi:hypothetical protein